MFLKKSHNDLTLRAQFFLSKKIVAWSSVLWIQIFWITKDTKDREEHEESAYDAERDMGCRLFGFPKPKSYYMRSIPIALRFLLNLLPILVWVTSSADQLPEACIEPGDLSQSSKQIPS
jgi:hypothetical protein